MNTLMHSNVLLGPRHQKQQFQKRRSQLPPKMAIRKVASIDLPQARRFRTITTSKCGTCWSKRRSRVTTEAGVAAKIKRPEMQTATARLRKLTRKKTNPAARTA